LIQLNTFLIGGCGALIPNHGFFKKMVLNMLIYLKDKKQLNMFLKTHFLKIYKKTLLLKSVKNLKAFYLKRKILKLKYLI